MNLSGSSPDLQIPGAEGAVGVVGVMLTVFAVFFLAVVVLIVVATTRRYRAAKAAGLDPFAGDIQVMGAVAHSKALAPDVPVEERLAEIERLYSARAISAAERDAARARILGTL